MVIILSLSVIGHSYGAGNGGDGAKKKTNYDKGAYIIKKAKKYEEKGKIKKATIQYEKALKYLIKSNK